MADSFSDHTGHVSKRVSTGIFVLKQLSHYVGRYGLIAAYYGLVYPFLLAYAVAIWSFGRSKTFRLLKRTMRAIFGVDRDHSCKVLYLKNQPCINISIHLYF